MLIALFIIAKIWKQPKNPTDEWIKKEWCIYIHNEILPTIKKNENLPFVAIWMDLEGIILSEIRQRKRSTI